MNDDYIYLENYETFNFTLEYMIAQPKEIHYIPNWSLEESYCGKIIETIEYQSLALYYDKFDRELSIYTEDRSLFGFVTFTIKA